jgi:hypothetical protein
LISIGTLVDPLPVGFMITTIAAGMLANQAALHLPPFMRMHLGKAQIASM